MLINLHIYPANWGEIGEDWGILPYEMYKIYHLKDSQVILDLVTRVLPVETFKAVFQDTDMELPCTYEIVAYTEEDYKYRLHGLLLRVLTKCAGCELCGVCEAECPTGALTVRNSVEINRKMCVHYDLVSNRTEMVVPLFSSLSTAILP